ncbi:MAG: LysM peptidoglycan-binding domain-containing protein [Anaerolineae bacterium]|nr:LysM peptidoglycan-binding domain-containing protein [Anaerolineae bacterium]NIN98876.1 LysM peptidoglycan-binding domain-containing protein [Anaerolineae bacterium]NIQ81787.1 LysM peptidoglycan-binding domain-containing protein [Anaerolineae bacterium]
MSGRWIAVIVIVLVVLCLVVGALAALYYWLNVPTAEAAVEPTVSIDSPRQGDEVVVGQAVQIFATGQDPSGIARMELWVDGQFVISQASALPDGTNPFPLMANWEPTTPGNHTITVRGYNMADASGQASISVNAVQGPDVPTEMPAEGCAGVPVLIHEVQEGETLEGIAAGYEVTVEDILACTPGVDPAVPLTPGQVLYVPYIAEDEGTGDTPPGGDVPPELPPEVEPPSVDEESPPPDEDPPPGEPPPDPAPDPPAPPADPPDPPPPPVALEFEALELETDQWYLAVYCNVQLEDAMERVPIDTTDYLDHVGPPDQNYWDIASELSGANSRPVAVTPGDTVSVFADCWGFSPGELIPRDLGSFTREHPEANWNGDPIEVYSEGGVGSFRVVYRICLGSCDPAPEINRPYDLQYNYDMVFGHYFTWSWDDDPTQPAEGFRLYRDGVLLYEQPGRNLRFMQVNEEDVTPWCDGVWAFTLTAYEGVLGVGPESLHSDSEVLLGDPCTKVVEVSMLPGGWEGLWTLCIPNDCPAPDPGCTNCEVEVWYGSIYANGERIEREPPPLPAPGEPWVITVDPTALIDSNHVWPGIPIADLFEGQDTMTVHLANDEDLTIGISLTDWDMFDADTLICQNAVTKAAANVVDGGPAEGLSGFWCKDEFNVDRAFLIINIDVLP